MELFKEAEPLPPKIGQWHEQEDRDCGHNEAKFESLADRHFGEGYRDDEGRADIWKQDRRKTMSHDVNDREQRHADGLRQFLSHGREHNRCARCRGEHA